MRLSVGFAAEILLIVIVLVVRHRIKKDSGVAGAEGGAKAA